MIWWNLKTSQTFWYSPRTANASLKIRSNAKLWIKMRFLDSIHRQKVKWHRVKRQWVKRQRVKRQRVNRQRVKRQRVNRCQNKKNCPFVAFFDPMSFTLCRAFDSLSFNPLSFDPVSFNPLSFDPLSFDPVSFDLLSVNRI